MFIDKKLGKKIISYIDRAKGQDEQFHSQSEFEHSY